MSIIKYVVAKIKKKKDRKRLKRLQLSIQALTRYRCWLATSPMYLNSFIQRNLASNLKLMLHKYHRICVALLETRLRDWDAKPPSQYKLATSNITREDDHEKGTAILKLIYRSYVYDPVLLNTRLQARAVRIFKEKNLYDLYILFATYSNY